MILLFLFPCGNSIVLFPQGAKWCFSYFPAQDTGFYYLQSRYYDPAIARFINADSLVSTGQGVLGNNMFAYCGNNPICYCDNSGHSHTESLNGYIGRDFMNTCLLEGGGAGGAIVGGLLLTGQVIDTFSKIWDDICNFFLQDLKK